MPRYPVASTVAQKFAVREFVQELGRDIERKREGMGDRERERERETRAGKLS